MIGYEEGRTRQFQGFGEVLERSRAAAVGAPAQLLLAGIGASNAALAAPLHVLRGAGVSAWRTDCSDLPALPAASPDLVIAVSQSGRSVETVALISELAEAGATTRAITNSDDNPLVRTAGGAITLGGAEDSRVSTVGFVTTFTALSVLAEGMAGIVAELPWEDLPALIDSTVDRARPDLLTFATEHLATGSVDVIGAADRLTPVEAFALLLREGPLVASAAYGTRAYLHGPMDVAGKDVAHVVLGAGRERELVEQLHEQTSRTLLLAEHAHRHPSSAAVEIPAGLTTCQRALLEVVVLQELLSIVSDVRGLPVDDPVFVRQDTKIAPAG
ncbi:SIS domain-containing protein [Microbacterium sp. NPDC057659]|uniref:SIS domain-containing protein n=1 Tax=Microbacterium sp. NPDC057659 TaxID=3346198 RepID=UPI00366F9323